VLYFSNFALGRYDDALDAAERAVELDPEDNDYQMTLAMALWNVGRSEKAIATIKNVVRREPENPRHFSTLARYLRQFGRSGEAQYWTVRAARLDPGNPELQLGVCRGQMQLWDVAGARRCMEAFLVEYPGHPEATQYLASINQDAELGLANARAMVETNPNVWYRKMQLAGWLTATGNDEEAIAMIRETFPEMFADPPQVRDMTIWLARSLVQAHLNLGDREKAYALIDVALAHLDSQRKLQGSGLATGTDDVMLLGWRGEISEAVNRLEEAIDRDWQFYSFGLMMPEGWPPELYEDPRFQAQVERQRGIMAEERAWYEANKDRDLLGAG
jgi:tetratricopeptide (TPR) repeat protein